MEQQRYGFNKEQGTKGIAYSFYLFHIWPAIVKAHHILVVSGSRGSVVAVLLSGRCLYTLLLTLPLYSVLSFTKYWGEMYSTATDLNQKSHCYSVALNTIKTLVYRTIGNDLTYKYYLGLCANTKSAT